jgi:hypothetical protein
MAVDDVFRLTVFMTQLGSQYMNTYYFSIKKEPPVTLAEATALANDFKEAFRALQNSGLVYRSWRLGQVYGAGVTWPPTDCNPVGGTTLEAAYSGTVIGGNATSALPPQCAMVTTLYTDQIGRRKRGRNYLPGLHEGMQSDGSIDSSTMTTFATQWNTLQNKYFSAGTDPTFRMGVWSYRTASGCERQKTPPYDHVKVETGHPELAFTPITRYVNRSVIYSQRKRTIGVGR